MNKVFLSHASQDKPFVRKVRDALRPYGKSIWLDEIEILPGDHLWNTIMDGISESDRALVFISEESVKSEWVQKEVKAFLDKEKSDPQIKIMGISHDSGPI